MISNVGPLTPDLQSAQGLRGPAANLGSASPEIALQADGTVFSSPGEDDIAAQKAKLDAMKGATQQAGGAAQPPKLVAVEEPFEKSKTYIPSAKAKLIETETTVSNLKRLAIGIKLKENVLMEGPTGAGKTALVKNLAHLTRNELRRINLSDMTDITEIIGGFKPTTDAETGKQKFEWRDGIVVEAMRKGQWLLLDEINLANPDILERMNSLFDDDRYLVLSEKPDNEMVKPDPNFMIFCTMNPASYSGRKELSDAMKNRLHMMWVDSLPPAENVEIMKAISKTKLPDETLLKMAMFNQTIADLAEHRQLGKRDGPYPFTLRDVIKWLGRIEEHKGDYGDINQVIYQEGQRVYVDRFQTKEDRDLVEDTLKAVFGKAAMPTQRNKEIKDLGNGNVQIGNAVIEKNPLGGEFVPGEDSKLILTGTGMDQMEKIAGCVQNDEMVLLVGPTASGKTSYVRYLANIANTNIRRYNLSQQTDTTDFIGGFVPTGQPGQFAWRDGILVESMKPKCIRDTQLMTKAGAGDNVRSLPAGTRLNYYMTKDINGEKWSFVECSDGQKGWVKDNNLKSDWIIFDEINLAEPSILERINSLLDDDRSLVLTEKNNERIQAHPSFKIFATMNPATGRYAGRKELSLAMRNRFTEIWHDELKNPAEIKTIVQFFMRKVPEGKELGSKMVDFQTELKDKVMKKEIGAKQRGGYVYTLRNLKYWSNYCKSLYTDELESQIQAKIQDNLVAKGMDKDKAQRAAMKKVMTMANGLGKGETVWTAAETKLKAELDAEKIDIKALKAEALKKAFIEGAVHCYSDEMPDKKDREAVLELAKKHFEGTGKPSDQIYEEWKKAGIL
ncbi:MAG: AAA family ATPase [Candidatus Eremiobacteraeota bacterium]|nr:AAA family ATPase [Candidatus Eremiobacteraeota bacterium]